MYPLKLEKERSSESSERTEAENPPCSKHWPAFSPDTGSIDLKNHSVSLLSIGVGFEKEMSGRENIILSGMLLWFSEEFIRSKMDEIIEFRRTWQIY